VGAKSCHMKDPSDALVNFDGTGLKTYGVFCAYDPVSATCNTYAVIWDGVGLKPVNEVYYDGTYCTGYTLVDYDGVGLKSVSYARRECG